MTRLQIEDINTPEHFDNVWRLEGLHGFDRVRMRQFIESPAVAPGERILDVGAGWMGIAQYALANRYPGNYTAIDFSEVARTRTFESLGPYTSLDYDIGNVLQMPYPGGMFDRACSGELIEHMEVPADLVAEMARVCRVGGLIIIGTLNDKCEAAQVHEYPEHLWSFTPEDLEEMLTKHCDAVRYWTTPGGAHYHFVLGVKR